MYLRKLTWCSYIQLEFSNYYLEWVIFIHYGREKYISKPEISGSPPYDYATMKDYPCRFGIADVNGKALWLKDVRNGMSVKIFAPYAHYDGYNWLSTSELGSGEYFEVLNRKVRIYYTHVGKPIEYDFL